MHQTDGSLRLCTDCRRLNSKTKHDAFPLPCIVERLDALIGAELFSTIDLASGYHGWWSMRGIDLKLLLPHCLVYIDMYGYPSGSVMPP